MMKMLKRCSKQIGRMISIVTLAIFLGCVPAHAYEIDEPEQKETDEDIPQCPSGYVVDGGTECDIEVAEVQYETTSIASTYAASDTITYTVSDTITAELDSNGVLTITGYGAINTAENGYPVWYSQRYKIKEVVIVSDTSVSSQGIHTIGEASFYYCYSLTKVTIPSTVTTIGEGAFANTALTTIVGMDGVKTFGDYAFQGTDMTSFSFPESTTTIGNYVFNNATNLITIDIPASVKSIGPLSYGSTAQEINVASGNTAYSSLDGVLFNKSKTELLDYPKYKKNASYTIPSTVKTISDYCFYNQNNLTSVTIPSSVISIGRYAFSYMPSLKSLTIPSSVTELGWGLCQENTAMESFTCYAKVEETPGYICDGCSALTKVVIDGPKKLGYGEFEGCTKLTDVSLSNTVEEIGNRTFYDCSSLKDICFPVSIRKIYKNAFTNTLVTEYPGYLTEVNGEMYMLVCQKSVTGTCNYEAAFEVLEIVNKERAAAGLSPLTMDKELLEAAMLRAAETSILFSHTRPDGTSCFTASSKMGGENIAWGYASAESVMNGWMNSQGHKGNILGSGYTSIGIGCFDGIFWVQCFGRGDDVVAATEQADTSRTFSINMSMQNPGWYYINDGWYYFYEDLSLKTGWQRIDFKWYYMDENAKMQTGWIHDGDKWYYLNPDGSMATGWIKVWGKWYYLNQGGSMATGWICDGGKWYYLNPDGSMATGWVKDGGKWYYMGASGIMATGWINDDGKWYYMGASGAMHIGWLNIKGTWYYTNASGAMVTGWKYVDGKCYYFYPSGAMAYNTYVEGCYLDANGVWVK